MAYAENHSIKGKTMQHKIIFISSLIFLLFVFHPPLQAGGDLQDKGVDPATSLVLKQSMSKLGTLMGKMRTLRLEEKKPNWKEVNQTLTEMSQILQKMQKADTSHTYQGYTNLLGTGLTDLKQRSAKKDKNIYSGFEHLTDTCFQCHAVHRSDDYWR